MATQVRQDSLGTILRKARIISEKEIGAALEEQQRTGQRFGEALISLGIVTQEDIDWALSNQLDIPYIRLKREMIDPAAVALVPAELCRAHNLLPLIRVGDELSIAMADPLDAPAIDMVTQASGCRINVSVALIREIREMIDEFHGVRSGVNLEFTSSVLSAAEEEAIREDGSAGQLLDYLLTHLIRHNLSSISLQPSGDEVVIRGRSGGRSRVIGRMGSEHYPVLAGLLHSRTSGSDGHLVQVLHGREFLMQLAVLHGEEGDYLTLRRHVASTFPADLAELPIAPRQKQRFAMLAHADQGIVFVASRNRVERCRFMDLLLEHADTDERIILSLGLEPGRLGKKFPRFPLPRAESERADLITASLAHEPDLLVVEDATALEPCTAVCRAAMGRRLVVAGLDVRGTANALELLLRHRRSNPLLTSFISGVVAFKGIQLLCPACRREYHPGEELRAALDVTEPPSQFFRADGCEACNFSGIGERRFLSDILVFDGELRTLFEQSANAADLLSRMRRAGYRGADEEGAALLREGAVAPEEYIAAVTL